MGLFERITGVWCNGVFLVIKRVGLFGRQSKEKIKIGSPDWMAWLAEHKTLAYEDKYGSVATLRKERRGNREYWYGYAYGVGRSEWVKVYLGKLDTLPAALLRKKIYDLNRRKKERKSFTDAERARRRRRSASARQRRYRQRLAAGQAGRSPGRERQDTEE